ncbi:LysM peptidoglycan-binding domain-containing protein [Nocardioides flavescens]|nr:LysM peptidoglycan-binding domain-containing protein [Nocardioides flavescens]
MTTMSLDTRFAPAPARGRAPAAAGTVRLTRRGRVVVLLVALVLAFAVGVFVTAASSVATLEPGAPEATEIVQVGSGDTLWGIASELAEDGRVRDMMHRIERLNALESTALQTGQRLVVPAS